MKIHIVQKGDTLWKIAQKYGVQFEELKQINSQLSNPDMIMPGMKIKVPGTGTAKNTQMKQSDTKITFGTKKEAPIPGAAASPIKEMPKKEMVMPAPAQPEPIVFEQILPKVKEQPMPQAAPVIPKMPQPIIPDVDINNYYMVNMSNMMVQKPQQMQPQPIPQPVPVQPQPEPVQQQPAPVQKPMQKPAVVNEEYTETPVQIQPYPVMEEGCVPITPVMPGTGFCPPIYPMHQPMYGPGPVQLQPMAYHHHHESSSFHNMQMPSWQYGEYMPNMNMQQWAPFYGGMPANPGVYAQHMYASPHGMHHHIESSSHYHKPNLMQPPYIHANQMHAEMPMMEEEEDCGCGGPKFPTPKEGDVNAAPQQMEYYQPQMQQWDQFQQGESHPQPNEMYQPQMNYNQQPMWEGQPQMGGAPMGYVPQPPIGGSQPGMYQPQPGGTQMGHMYQPQMAGPMQVMPQAPNSGFQPSPYQMPMQPWQKGMLQPQMNPSQAGVYVPPNNYPPNSHVPFYGQDDYASDIGQMKNYSAAFDLPRYADESNE